MDSWLVVLAVLVGAPLTTIITNHFTRPKVKADIASQYNAMALQLVNPQRERIDQLERDMKASSEECKERIDQVEAWAKLLYAHLVEVGETPITFEQSIHLHRRRNDPGGKQS